MAKKRVHEIAKERDLESKEVLARLQKAGLEVTTASSSVDEAEAAKVLGNGASATKAPAKPKKAEAKADGAKPKSEAKPAAGAKAGGGAAAPATEAQPAAEGKPKGGASAPKAQPARPAITRPPSPEGEVK